MLHMQKLYNYEQVMKMVTNAEYWGPGRVSRLYVRRHYPGIRQQRLRETAKHLHKYGRQQDKYRNEHRHGVLQLSQLVWINMVDVVV